MESRCNILKAYCNLIVVTQSHYRSTCCLDLCNNGTTIPVLTITASSEQRALFTALSSICFWIFCFLLFQGCFAMDPSQRLTCEQLLNHPYFDRYDIYSDKNRQRGQRDQRVRTTIILLFVLRESHWLFLRQLFMWCSLAFVVSLAVKRGNISLFSELYIPNTN